MRRALMIAGISAVALVVQATVALAIPGGWVDVDDDDSEVEVGATDEQSSGERGEGSNSASQCSWSRVPSDQLDVLWWENAPELAGGILDPSEYDWYWRSCPNADVGISSDLIPVPRGGPPVDATVLRDEAIDRLVLPGPAVAMNPPGEHVVHIESWLWIDDAIWATHSRSASAGGVTTTVEATPRRVIWDMGNGDTAICEGPGTPYDPARSAHEQATECSYMYQHSSAEQPGEAYQVTATVEWEVSWSVTGAAGGGALPAMLTTSSTAVRVAEMQALNQ